MANTSDDPALDPPDKKVETTRKVPSAIEQRSRGDHARIRFFTTVAALLHACISGGILFMGLSANPKIAERYSESVVIASFGALITVIWAIVASWEAAQELTKPEMPTWEWHRAQFTTAVFVMFALTLFLWPSLLVFMLHSLGVNFFILVTQFDAQLMGVLWFHFGIFFVLFLLNICIIITAARTLRKAQRPDGDNYVRAPGYLPWLFALKLIADIVGLGELILSTVATEGNSGLILCTLVQLLCWSMGMYLAYKLSRQAVDASWLVMWQSAAIVHVFVGWIMFWVAASLLILVGHLRVGFFAALVTGQSSVVYFELVLFALFIIVYTGLLLCHARCMFVLNTRATTVITMADSPVGIELAETHKQGTASSLPNREMKTSVV